MADIGRGGGEVAVGGGLNYMLRSWRQNLYGRGKSIHKGHYKFARWLRIDCTGKRTSRH